MQGFWDLCLSRFQKELPAQQFNTWIRPLQLTSSQASSNELSLVAPNRFVLQWVKERFLSQIEAFGLESLGTPIRVSLALKESPEPAASPAALAAQPTVPKPSPATRFSLIPEFTFDNFVPGKANQLARAAALQVAEHSGTSYNPLFIYGGVGLGKTHLIHAVGNFVLAQRPTAKVRYLHAAQYVSDVVRAYQQKSFDEFKRYYHSLDILLIDDIQFFTGKDRTQEEFFYAFNALIEAHKQLIITCDTYPKDLAGIDERLKSRFSWGLSVAIEPPEQEMRVAIILKKAEAVSVPISEEVAFFIAKHIRSNVRELEGALKSVMAYARFNGKDISLESAKEALRDLLSAQNRQITVENIQKTVADYYKLKISDMHSKKRSRNIARPRQLAMALAKELTQLSLPDIGDAFGNRDHTTVLHACRTISTLREKDHTINRDYHVLEQVLKG
ncbi:MAG: chromosomal replication initiation protein DnaA [Betaproteobacteria bacterium RIFCSPLOWO2_12_FULL_63_13]|nr:MAG: chromosomal replication initiation protein DnaA [Betaproteobacteria bacterium RIFCSPLOWO2_02_FULL_63_19]OGA46938.1 MAG: chromosomal replication initiation protein DnaA [Betaproteobacteria bacterium RIFCSPLOWO2_12_FULL_63_13]